MKYGLQLYSIRDMAEKNFEGMLKAVAEMGYEMVESAGFFGHSAEEVREMLDRYGLTLCSTHTSQHEVFDRFERTLAFHKRLGCTDIVLPAVMSETREQIDYTVACINRYQPILEAEGIRLHFHNHSDVFLPNKDGIVAFDEFGHLGNPLLFHPYGVRLRAVVKAYSAGNAPLTLVLHDLDAHGIEFFTHFKALFRTGGYTASAPFAVFFIYENHFSAF